ncbi:MAG: tRNA preQ1(34) S-adenosylmethionine ribosyltransferase-isomerase QueA [Pseudomonadota bacterium]
MRVDLFDFNLLADRIALRPVEPRDAAKMLLVDGTCKDSVVSNLPSFLRAGDVIVFNDTKVIPTQLQGVRIRNGVAAGVSATLHTRLASNRWLAFVKGAKKLHLNDLISFSASISKGVDETLDCQVTRKQETGDIELTFDLAGAAFDERLMAVGTMPLPPYIAGKRQTDEKDMDDYQTAYAREQGAVAAPTAGLHFTDELMQALRDKGVLLKFVTLHVGPGTFLPVKVEDTEDHQMHSEWGVVSQATADAINKAHQEGNRLICVGTTSLRLIESAANSDGQVEAWEGDTDIFITPGYRFKAVDMLMTNFHLPKSTLFMLVSAFCGLETMRSAYEYAIENQYRFYSYGDASLLYRQT